MLSAIPSSWGSPLEVSSKQSPPFVSEVSPLITNNEGGLQYVAYSLPEEQVEGIFGYSALEEEEALPSIDETLFDFPDEVPDLEEVTSADDVSLSAAFLPLDDLLLEEIPQLEEAPFDDDNNHDGDQDNKNFLDWEQNVPQAPKWEVHSSPEMTVPDILVGPEALGIAEEVVESPVSVYVESCGSESPLSCYSMASGVQSPPEKRRRVSQISMSSYCSSAGDSLFSPSDSETDSSKRGGRRSRFSPEDRKERKKAQNRTAAERYRQKRKVQEDTISEEEQQLIDGNNVLKTEVTKLQAEVSCLKRLMREMLLAKGIPIPPKKQNSSTK